MKQCQYKMAIPAPWHPVYLSHRAAKAKGLGWDEMLCMNKALPDGQYCTNHKKQLARVGLEIEIGNTRHLVSIEQGFMATEYMEVLGFRLYLYGELIYTHTHEIKLRPGDILQLSYLEVK